MENGFKDMVGNLRSDQDGVKAVIVTDLNRISSNITTSMKCIHELNDLKIQLIPIRNPDMFKDPNVTKLLTSAVLVIEDLDNKFTQYLVGEMDDNVP